MAKPAGRLVDNADGPHSRDGASRLQRKKLWRQRQERDELVAPVVLGLDEIALLESAGVLRPCDADDRKKIGEAVSRLLAALARWDAFRR